MNKKSVVINCVVEILKELGPTTGTELESNLSQLNSLDISRAILELWETGQIRMDNERRFCLVSAKS